MVGLNIHDEIERGDNEKGDKFGGGKCREG